MRSLTLCRVARCCAARHVAPAGNGMRADDPDGDDAAAVMESHNGHKPYSSI